MRLTLQEFIEAAHCRKPALNAARSETATVQAGSECSHVTAIDNRPGREARAVAVRRQRLQVARVCGHGMRRAAPLGREVAAETLDPRDRVRGHPGSPPRVAHAPGSGPSESAMRSAIRPRNSVLIPGWKRSRSVLPSAST